jgi:hypothetical protein
MPFEEVRDRLVSVPTTDVAVWLNAVRQMLEKSGSLNKTAASWTGVSVALTGLSVLLGARLLDITTLLAL